MKTEKLKKAGIEQPVGPDTRGTANALREVEKTFEVERAEPLREKIESEVVPEATIERVMNQVERAELIERYAETSYELNKKEARALGAIVSERGWQAVFTELNPGDKVVNFTTPAGSMSIKAFNTLFGEQATDNIIAARKEIIAGATRECGLEQLMQSYNSGLFKLGDGGDDTTKLETKLNQVSAQIRDKMKQVISAEIESAVRLLAEKGVNDKDARAKFENIKNILDNRGGYRVSFGIAEVPAAAKGGDDLSHIVDAVSMCSEAAQRSRRGDAKSERFGETYDEKNILTEAKEIDELGEKLFGQKVYDENGGEYEIFTRAESGNRILNRDLLRAVRKNEFHAATESKDDVNLVRQYVQRINLIDSVMPVTAVDAESGRVARDTARRKNYIERDENGAWQISNQLNDKERKELAADLRHDQKDARFLSPEFFHAEAMKKKNCTYVSVDVLDLGVDALLGYEQDLQNINRDPNSLHEISAAASDVITNRMREIRGAALEVYKKYFGDEEVVGLVGGDELTFAVDEMENKDILQNFLVDLKYATGARVVKTAVGSADRHSAKAWSEKMSAERKRELAAEHQAALKRAEAGSKACKEMEKMLREVERILETKLSVPANKKSDEIDKVFEKNNIMNLSGSVAVERPDGAFVMAYRSANGEVHFVSHDDAINKISAALRDIQKEYAS